MLTIHKFGPFTTRGSVFRAPKDAKFLSCNIQYGNIMAWAKVDTDNNEAEYTAEVFGTGWELPENIILYKFIGTVKDSDNYIWHLFIKEGC